MGRTNCFRKITVFECSLENCMDKTGYRNVLSIIAVFNVYLLVFRYIKPVSFLMREFCRQQQARYSFLIIIILNLQFLSHAFTFLQIFFHSRKLLTVFRFGNNNQPQRSEIKLKMFVSSFSNSYSRNSRNCFIDRMLCTSLTEV